MKPYVSGMYSRRPKTNTRVEITRTCCLEWSSDEKDLNDYKYFTLFLNKFTFISYRFVSIFIDLPT